MIDFKKVTWQQWTAFGLISALVVTGVVLHLVQPVVSYAMAEVMTIVCSAVCGVSGFLLGRKKNAAKSE